MFSITLRRSAATLGVVVAGLLAAAVPASAMPIYVQYPSEVVSRPDQTAPRGTQVGSEGVKAPTKADDDQTKDHVKAVVVLIGANDYGYTEGNGQPCWCPTRL